MVKYLNFHNSSFALRYFFSINGKATQCDTPLFFHVKISQTVAALTTLIGNDGKPFMGRCGFLACSPYDVRVIEYLNNFLPKNSIK
jgi:hypothetical protein